MTIKNIARLIETRNTLNKCKKIISQIPFEPDFGFVNFENKDEFVIPVTIHDELFGTKAFNTLCEIIREYHLKTQTFNAEPNLHNIAHSEHYIEECCNKISDEDAYEMACQFNQKQYKAPEKPEFFCKYNFFSFLENIQYSQIIRPNVFINNLDYIQELHYLLLEVHICFTQNKKEIELYTPLFHEFLKEDEQNIKTLMTDKGIVFNVENYYYFSSGEETVYIHDGKEPINEMFKFIEIKEPLLTINGLKEQLKQKFIFKKQDTDQKVKFKVGRIGDSESPLHSDITNFYELETIIQSINLNLCSQKFIDNKDFILDLLRNDKKINYKILMESGLYIDELFNTKNAFYLIDSELFKLNYQDSGISLKSEDSYVAIKAQHYIDFSKQFFDDFEPHYIVFNQNHEFVSEIKCDSNKDFPTIRYFKEDEIQIIEK